MGEKNYEKWTTNKVMCILENINKIQVKEVRLDMLNKIEFAQDRFHTKGILKTYIHLVS